MRPGGGESGSERAKRLLVLGAGAGQLGLLEAARGRGLYVIAADRNPAAPGFRFADRRAIISVEDEPQIDRLAAAERVDGVDRAGHRLAGRDRRPDRRAARPAASDRPGDGACSRSRSSASASGFAEAGVPASAARRLLDARGGRARPPRGFGYPCVVKAPDRQGQKGLVLVRERAAARARRSSSRSASRARASSSSRS